MCVGCDSSLKMAHESDTKFSHLKQLLELKHSHNFMHKFKYLHFTMVHTQTSILINIHSLSLVVSLPFVHQKVQRTSNYVRTTNTLSFVRVHRFRFSMQILWLNVCDIMESLFVFSGFVYNIVTYKNVVRDLYLLC